ncbi:MAG TPA: sugar transferase [Anaerolineae bacterium]
MNPSRRRFGFPAKTRQPERWILAGRDDAIRAAWAAFEEQPGRLPRPAGLVPVAEGAGLVPRGAMDAPILGRRGDLPRLLSGAGGDHVILVVSPDARPWLADLVAELAALPVDVWVLPAPCPSADGEEAGLRDGLFAGAFGPGPAPGPARILKRALDLALGGAALILSLPLLLVSALAVKLDTPGPALFRQMRVGRGGRLFPMFKFRTMAGAAGPLAGEGDPAGDDGPDPKPLHDPRVTRVGRFLRRTSLDELPQLVNVVAGQMSLVGPRPELPRLVTYYTPEQWRRLSVPQGMTGWWQVNGRAEKVMYLCPEDDLYYVRHFSLRLDLLILWKTVGAVFGGRGAY